MGGCAYEFASVRGRLCVNKSNRERERARACACERVSVHMGSGERVLPAKYACMKCDLYKDEKRPIET